MRPEPPATPPRVLIASADRFLGRRLLVELGRDDRADVVGTADCLADVVAAAAELVPDVVVFDASLPRCEPFSALAAVADVSRAGAIVLVDDPSRIDWALLDDAPVVAVVRRDGEAAELTAMVYELAALSAAPAAPPAG